MEYEVATNGVSELVVKVEYTHCLIASLALLASTMADEDIKLWRWNPFQILVYRHFWTIFLFGVSSVCSARKISPGRVIRLQQDEQGGRGGVSHKLGPDSADCNSVAAGHLSQVRQQSRGQSSASRTILWRSF